MTYKPQDESTSICRSRNENNQAACLGLALCQHGRRKGVINLLHGFNIVISNRQCLFYETAIANIVVLSLLDTVFSRIRYCDDYVPERSIIIIVIQAMSLRNNIIRNGWFTNYTETIPERASLYSSLCFTFCGTIESRCALILYILAFCRQFHYRTKLLMKRN